MTDFNLSLGRKGKAGEFDSSEIKEGTQKKDLQSKISQNIFDAFDNDKDGTLNGIEVEKFLAQLKDAAKNDNLSKREAKKLLKLEGIKGVKAEKLFEFLKEIAAVEVEEDYSAFDDGMGVDIKNKPNQTDTDLKEVQEEAEEEVIDNTKAYYENGRIMTLGDDGKSILVQENENSDPVKLQVDENGNIISYAKNGESFKMTAKRLGLATEGKEFEKFKELNEKAAKKGYFLVGGRVLVPSDSVENLALDKVDVNPDTEIAKYVKFMAKKQAEREQSETAQKTKELTDEEMQKKYPGIAKPDENTKYEPPKWEIPTIPGMPPVESDAKPQAPAPQAEPPKPSAQSAEKTESGNPKKLAVTKDDFKIENLRKRYPEDKYTESKDDKGIISFTNKQTGKIAFGIEHFENGNFTAILYKDGKASTALALQDDSILRVQYNDNGDIISDATYDIKDNKLFSENFFDDNGILIKALNYNKNGSLKEEITVQDGYAFLKSFNADGSVDYTYDEKNDKYESPVANELKEYIYAKSSVGLPVSKDKEIKETVLKKITPENVKAVLEAYKDVAGVDLITDISDEWAISASDLEEIKNHINKCAEKLHNYKKDVGNFDSQVKNDYHTGPEFSVTQKDEVITVKNKSTGKEHKIDLEKLLKNITPEKRAHMKKIIQDLPGEVLEDLSIEADTFYEDEKRGNVGGYYIDGSDKLFNIHINGTDSLVMVNIDKKNLVHEIGHAVDFNGYFSNTSTIGDNENFRKVIDKEMKAFLEAGNKRFDKDEEVTYFSSDKSFSYCTYNDKEMFAECYSLLMIGDCSSKECILKYFPETLKAVEQHINEIRKLPESKRH